ncbi:MAG: hypothetical protein QOC85_3012, partial [Streptomyces sp.]|nr:hypothetical protein [Streptomyces sp.]
MTRRTRLTRAALAGCSAAVLLGLGAPSVRAGTGPSVDPSPASLAAAHRAATTPATLDTLTRFFAHDAGTGETHDAAGSRTVVHARVDDDTVPVRYLSPDFVAGKKGAPVARLVFMATGAVAADGREASVWTAPQGGTWQVVNIASGDDETKYAALGARSLPGGTVFHEPQIDAWYVASHARVLPLDEDARRAIGARGTTLDAYRARVHRAYADKLPGSPYATSGEAGGYGPEAAFTSGRLEPGRAAVTTSQGGSHEDRTGRADPAVAVVSALAGAG